VKRFLCVGLLMIVAEIPSFNCSSVNSQLARFLEYIKNIDAIERRDDAALRREKAIVRVEEVFIRVNNLFARGAFANLPHIKMNFDSLFKEVDPTLWPTPSTLRAWRDDVKAYKKFIMQTYFTSQAISNRADLDQEALDALDLLCSLLVQNILTDAFFNFSPLERILDACFVQPLEFTYEHPYFVMGGILICACAAYYGCSYLQQRQEESEIVALIKKNKDLLTISASQEDIEAAIWAMYRKWCVKKADGDMKRYQKLASNDKIYNHFKIDVNDYLKKQRFVL
jgi:hypothetical protein